jgi:ATP-dependent phosphofructokinase / diphosphate-dependent phosphofructokinase
MKIGILSGGGDCAGINAVIRAVVTRATSQGHEVVGIKRGWAGLLSPSTVALTKDSVEDIVSLGGTILLTSRTNPLGRSGGAETVMNNAKKLGLDALIAIGGDDTLGVAHKLSQLGMKVVGVPKTIDNDLSATDVTFGFDSAVNVATEAIDRVRSTGESHERVMIVEVMGRDAGWIAAHAGLAGGAHMVLVPEEEFETKEVTRFVEARRKRGKNFTLIVVAEGAKPKEWSQAKAMGEGKDEFGHPELGGIGHFLAKEIEKLGVEAREVTLGHILRGGSPSAYDRVLATRFGVAAADLVVQGRSGFMVALRGQQIVNVKLEDALKLKEFDKELLGVSRLFQ